MVQLASSVLWLTDAAAIPDFIRGTPPSQARRARWWYFLHQFPLVARHLPGHKNELADHLSRHVLEEKLGERLDELAKESFEKMDEGLDLVIVPVSGQLVLSGLSDAVIAEVPELVDLEEGGTMEVDGKLWARDKEEYLREGLRYIPEVCVGVLFNHYHTLLGHPSPDRLMMFLRARFAFRHPGDVHKQLRHLSGQCTVCIRAKPSRQRDRGPQGSLPIPEMVNAEVAFDLVHLGGVGESSCVLFMMCTLSHFVQAVPCSAAVTQEDIARIFFHRWIAAYGATGMLTADNDVRWRGAADTELPSMWGNLLRLHGIELHLTTP
jgi:hypothetical protein